MLKENIEYHTFRRNGILTIVLEGLILLPEARIYENLKNQGLNPTCCSELPTHTRYSIYNITFAPAATLVQLNHIRYIENIKIY